jgi:hypothetical protein
MGGPLLSGSRLFTMRDGGSGFAAFGGRVKDFFQPGFRERNLSALWSVSGVHSPSGPIMYTIFDMLGTIVKQPLAMKQ